MLHKWHKYKTRDAKVSRHTLLTVNTQARFTTLSLTFPHTYTVAVFSYEIRSKLVVHLHIIFVNIHTYDYSRIIMYTEYCYSITKDLQREAGSTLIVWVTVRR